LSLAPTRDCLSQKERAETAILRKLSRKGLKELRPGYRVTMTALLVPLISYSQDGKSGPLVE
jgi:hypothetical protein